MLILYGGYPAALTAVEIVRELWPGASGRVRTLPPRRQRALGVALCRRVYGPAFSSLLARVRRLHPDLARWVIEEGYGRVLSRPGLSARERELLSVAALGALGWEPALVSHLVGARRLGCTPAQCRAAWQEGMKHARPGTRAAARLAWRRAQGVVDRFRGGF